MTNANTKNHTRDLPIILSYYIFPFIGILYNMAFKCFANFEFVWVGLFFVVLLSGMEIKYKRTELSLIYILIVLLVLKYLIPFAYETDITMRPLVMDLKWILYLFLAFFWVHRYGIPKMQSFYDGALFFCKVYICYNLYMLFFHGQVRAGLLSESNYDCYLFLVGYCFISVVKHRKIDYVIFFIATMLSLSQTGLVSFLLLSGLIIWYKNRKLLIGLVPFGIFLIIIFFLIRRGDTNISSIDRFIFFEQCFEYFKASDMATAILGTFPGVAMKINPIPAFQFYISNFENINSIDGCYAFYFHSTYLRLAITWGIPILVLLVIFLTYKFFKTRFLPMKMILALFMLESFSLSTLTLTTVSVLFFIAFFSSFHYNKIARFTNRINNTRHGQLIKQGGY